MKPNSHGLYPASTMDRMAVKDGTPYRPQPPQPDGTEDLTPMELAASYGFERHRQIMACPLM